MNGRLAIEMRDVCKTYGGKVVALAGLNLEIMEGSIFGLVGPNGAGKTTTINLIAGVAKKDSGIIRILGSDVSSRDFSYKNEVGFLLEEPLYLERLSAIEYLSFIGELYEINRREAELRISELIEFFDLDQDKNRLIETYSSGMKKKVSLAATIIHKPKLLVLDEPFENMDPIFSKLISDTLVLHAQKGGAVLLTSHNLHSVQKLCGEVAIINNGKIVFQSRVEDIRKKIRDSISQETYNSLEEIFVDVVSAQQENNRVRRLSWL